MNDIVTRDFNPWISDNPGLKDALDMADFIHTNIPGNKFPGYNVGRAYSTIYKIKCGTHERHRNQGFQSLD